MRHFLAYFFGGRAASGARTRRAEFPELSPLTHPALETLPTHAGDCEVYVQRLGVQLMLIERQRSRLQASRSVFGQSLVRRRV